MEMEQGKQERRGCGSITEGRGNTGHIYADAEKKSCGKMFMIVILF